MKNQHIKPKDLTGKVIDIHSHVGVSLKAYSCLEYPYAQTIEGLYYRQLASDVDVNVVFPFSADLFFDQIALTKGNMIPASQPVSDVPYAVENKMVLYELFRFCPEYRDTSFAVIRRSCVNSPLISADFVSPKKIRTLRFFLPREAFFADVVSLISADLFINFIFLFYLR